MVKEEKRAGLHSGDFSGTGTVTFTSWTVSVAENHQTGIDSASRMRMLRADWGLLWLFPVNFRHQLIKKGH